MNKKIYFSFFMNFIIFEGKNNLDLILILFFIANVPIYVCWNNGFSVLLTLQFRRPGKGELKDRTWKKKKKHNYFFYIWVCSNWCYFRLLTIQMWVKGAIRFLNSRRKYTERKRNNFFCILNFLSKSSLFWEI